MSATGAPIRTVDDLKIRTCYICREEDSSTPGTRRTRAEHGFVHPCRCTLVAHEKCLLQWMDSGYDARRQCAQCKWPYSVTVDRRSSLALRLMDAGNRLLSRFGGYTLVGCTCIAILASMYAFCVAYAWHAAQWMLGHQVFDSFLKHPMQWPPLVLLVVPVVPLAFFTLVADFAGLMTFVHDFGPLFIPLLPMRFSFSSFNTSAFWDWPPQPWLVGVLYPFAHSLYFLGLCALEERLLDDDAVARRYQVARRARVARARNILDPDDQRDANDVRAPGRDDGQAALANELTPLLDAVLRAGRTVCSMLLLPPLASFVGTLLRRAAALSHHLRIFLGIAQPPYVLASTSWLHRAGRSLGVLVSDSPDTWSDFEPSWWHSLIGLALVVVLKDSVALAYKLMVQREGESRVLVDLPFTDLDLPSLEFDE